MIKKHVNGGEKESTTNSVFESGEEQHSADPEEGCIIYRLITKRGGDGGAIAYRNRSEARVRRHIREREEREIATTKY